MNKTQTPIIAPTEQYSAHTKKHEFWDGIKAALPIILGYLPLGMAFGVLAAQEGLSKWQVLLMSLCVYAGAGQFIAVSLLAVGASVTAIIFTTFLVNSRHILMSAALSPYVRGFPRRFLAIITFRITDETFAVAMVKVCEQKRGSSFFLGLNLTAHFFWIFSTVLGGAVGNFIPNPQVWGLHFALPAMFIALLVMQIKNKTGFRLAIMAMLFSLVFKIILPGNWNIILACILTATIGVVMENGK